MNPLMDEADRQRRELLARERKTQRELVRTYGRLIRDTQVELRRLEQAIRAAQSSPRDLAKLQRQEQRATELLNGLRRRLAQYVQEATPALTRLQEQHVQAAVEDQYQLIRTSLTPGPPGAGVEFSPPPAAVVAEVIGKASDGSPLGDLLAEIAGAQHRQARDVLTSGIAAGKSPRVIAREFTRVTGVALDRSLLIARTEGLGAYRAASLATMRANGTVKGWAWQATLDRRTCPVCWAMSGTEHTLDEQLTSHPGCRCAMVPLTRTWAELGFPDIPDTRPAVLNGPEVFDTLPPDWQRQILGPGKYHAYAEGRITLADLVRATHHSRWGEGKRTATIAEALAHA